LTRCCLDASALLALLKEEEGYQAVNELFRRAHHGEITLSMSIVNLIEVFYLFIRERGMAIAVETLEQIYASSIEIIDTISRPVLNEASRLKGTYKMALGDAIGLATARSLDAPFVTADYNELGEVEQKEAVSLLWIRPPGPKQ
jgi:PIN domain nuclease of toxin-antitoxin system